MSLAAVPTTLLAKQVRSDRPPVSLQQHSLDTERAAQMLFRADRRWGRNWCRFFQMPEEHHARFLLHLRIAALFHDLGKANHDFYQAVTGVLRESQTLRHEHLTAFVLHLPVIRSWLETNPTLDVEIVTAAVLSHHFKASESGEWRWGQARGTGRVRVFLRHPEVRAILQRVQELAQLTSPPPEITADVWGTLEPWEQVSTEGPRVAREFRRAVRRDEGRRRLLVATKTALIVADAVASGLVREGHPIAAWIDDIIDAPAITPGDVAAAVIQPRIRQLERASGKRFTFHAFQVGAAQHGPRVLLLAACGAGKTLAAWQWAAAQAAERHVGKVIFLYPTRGTATEGFRDYVGWAPEADAALVHGTARYELEATLGNPPESLRGKHPELSEERERLFALGLWGCRYFSATVDQFLSFMEHRYPSTCLLPVLADALLIIDEVHSFDRHMFDVLVAFLKAFEVPALLMTATLPLSRRQELEAAGLRIYPGEEDRALLADLDAEECHPRYAIATVADEAAAAGLAMAAYRDGKRILWVVNQVARCQRIARALGEQLGSLPLCYHSRFRLMDRHEVHRATVDGFRDPARAVVAITTQVCEMSLDIDADLLISELAPVPALVQRFGRANRHRARGNDFRATIVTYAPAAAVPYTREDLGAARAFLAEVSGEAVSQRDLAEALERHAPGEPAADGSARLLESGYYAIPGPFRDDNDHTQPAVLDGDLTDLRARINARRPYDGLLVPMPMRATLPMDERPGWVPRYLGVASSVRYHPHLGFLCDEL